MDPLRACALTLAVLRLVGIVTSRQLCFGAPRKHGAHGDLRKAAEVLRWCYKSAVPGNPFIEEGGGQYVPDLQTKVSPEEVVQYVLDGYKPWVDYWLSTFKLKQLSIPIYEGKDKNDTYSFTGHDVRLTMLVKNLTVLQVNTRNVSILLSVYFRRLVVLVDIQADVCILFSTSGPYQCAQVRNTQKIKVKNAAASLIATWQIAETGEALSLEPSDTRLDVNHNGTEVKPGKLEVIPAKYQIYFEDRARKLLDTPAKKTWPLFKEGIMGWLKHGLKNQFDEAIRPSLTHAFNTIILNA